jgi:hypothetical protein
MASTETEECFMKAPYNPISVSKISPERISQCSQRHIQSVLESDVVFLQMARNLALAVKNGSGEDVVHKLSDELLNWLEE